MRSDSRYHPHYSIFPVIPQIFAADNKFILHIPHSGNLHILVCRNHISCHIGKPSSSVKARLLYTPALIKPGLYLRYLYTFSINHNLRILAVKKCNIPARENIAQISDAVNEYNKSDTK